MMISRPLVQNGLTLVFTMLLMACAPNKSDTQNAVRDLALENQMDSSAHWVRQNIMLLPEIGSATKTMLIIEREGASSTSNYKEIALNKISMPEGLLTKVPHLATWNAYRIDTNRDTIIQAVKSKLSVTRANDTGLKAVHSVQTGFLLDDLFTSGLGDADERMDYGAKILQKDDQTGWPSRVKFSLWAPTALTVTLKLDDVDGTVMEEDTATGTWAITVDIAPDQRTAYPAYHYEINAFHPATNGFEVMTVTDPWSLGLTANGRRSLVIDLNDPSLKPESWGGHEVPTVSHPEAQILYEAHIGDFSARDESTPPAARGKYAAFQSPESAPMQHLQLLVDAGLTSFHILPAYDIGTVDEDKGAPVSLTDTVGKACDVLNGEPDFCKSNAPDTILMDLLESYASLSSDAQAVIDAIDEVDDYNWGYDPVHYTVPEGSYASEGGGPARIIEFREMVKILHGMGLRVVMDVVYNHTYTAALDRHSVLDKIVPGYWHRRHPITGEIETSTCCPNTATERAMMAKLMTDSLVVWARDYGIDGFRFDLMGHQPKSLMLAAREAVKAVDPDTYFYGEGWNFGEVAHNARFQQATQTELAGSSIGTFSDRLRDAIRGGGPSLDGVDLRKSQGLGNGLFLIPNEITLLNDRADYDAQLDIARVGLAGNLASFPLTTRSGETITGDQLSYGGGPAGYAIDPADTINYVSKHDNQTLWDNHQYRLPNAMSLSDRARLQVQSLSWPLYGQGIPFLHMGSELLRSKSFLRDSYNYGHWFNRVDFTGQSTTYNVGLPPAEKDAMNWPLIQSLISSNKGRDMPTEKAMLDTRDQLLDMIKIRSRSKLFSLETEDQIKRRVSFLNTGVDQIDGLVVMQIDDGFINPDIKSIDPNWSSLIVIFNHRAKNLTFPYQHAGNYSLHPVLIGGADPVVKASAAEPSGFQVPAFTTAVFVRADEVQG